jgi:hypothetical protein
MNESRLRAYQQMLSETTVMQLGIELIVFKSQLLPPVHINAINTALPQLYG